MKQDAFLPVPDAVWESLHSHRAGSLARGAKGFGWAASHATKRRLGREMAAAVHNAGAVHHPEFRCPAIAVGFRELPGILRLDDNDSMEHSADDGAPDALGVVAVVIAAGETSFDAASLDAIVLPVRRTVMEDVLEQEQIGKVGSEG
ncbi:hypothetical protein [Aromatoleum diolicum]|uniref:Uncharacterized protein n=1 Tax=Aromatoleum diolicum TaxID=75796 RepID=A0ABX1QFZ6_9RHOO|nr:hypothetical protein [Aromatoleum diolicum]NMG76873.1 hypothetical protein [Aromatoleum diolicum]